VSYALASQLRPPGQPEAHDGRRKTLAATVADAIERDIVAMGWPVGETIASEAQLLDRHGVSRPVLRQATSILESRRIARMRRGPGGGLVVTAPSEASVTEGVALFLEYLKVSPEEVSEARSALEVIGVGLTTERLSEEGVAQLRGIVELERSRVAEGHFDQLQLLHIALAELSGNRVLSLFIQMLTTLSQHQYFHHGATTGDPEKAEQVHHDHVDIVEAVVGYDQALARRRMHRHLERTVTAPPPPSSSIPAQTSRAGRRARRRRG
jgi:DNA-binding FadR family transcriptional regulator